MDDLLTVGRMRICPAGAHVTSTDTDLGELFYLSSTSGFPIRGGIPVIAPAFADLLPDAPRHGWARTSDWRVTTDSRSFTATLSRESLGLTLTGHELTDGLRITLTMSNDSGEDRVVQMGFHPYFLVADVRTVRLHGLDGVTVTDRLTGAESTQAGEVSIDSPFDRIFHASREVRIDDGERVITVASEGADSVVVWNPGEADMKDVGPGEWSRFVCVEPALLGADLRGVTLPAGEELTLAMTVTVSPS
ncbi:MAG: D-hexose-6-phosphate mutarotase [Corynebacterium humireducens]|jgi:glucose-6-phosphate 1-epimerase|uniref:D-hexose-6-phosphate mutarotase n=1 Tax=Corynebacterium humireducens TaxID=1223514 RepID=A0A7X6PMM0_9CORY|nr:D-hexose-6-phosphate mutarotase [Corynebacterium humireducens]